jgi:thymidine phosphorylase
VVIVVSAKPGDTVEAGEPLAHVFARTAEAAETTAAEVLAAYAFADGPVERPALLLETVG